MTSTSTPKLPRYLRLRLHAQACKPMADPEFERLYPEQYRQLAGAHISDDARRGLTLMQTFLEEHHRVKNTNKPRATLAKQNGMRVARYVGALLDAARREASDRHAREGIVRVVEGLSDIYARAVVRG